MFRGWFTESPDIEDYRKTNLVGKRYYWTNKSLFSDDNRDWMLWNDENLDSLYDNVFLLRAEWDVKVTFDANGGLFSDNTRMKSNVYRPDEEIVIMDAPIRKGYQFLNWQTADVKEYNPGTSYKVKKNTTFTAQWKSVNSTITFMNSNSTYATVEVKTGKSINSDDLSTEVMPANASKDGYLFKEWNTQADGKGIAFTGETLVNGNMTVYATFTEKPDPEPDPNPKKPEPEKPDVVIPYVPSDPVETAPTEIVEVTEPKLGRVAKTGEMASSASELGLVILLAASAVIANKRQH